MYTYTHAYTRMYIIFCDEDLCIRFMFINVCVHAAILVGDVMDRHIARVFGGYD